VTVFGQWRARYMNTTQTLDGGVLSGAVRPLRSSCIHEAGHAVVCHTLRQRVARVELNVCGLAGVCDVDLERVTVLEEVAMLLAGHVATSLYGPGSGDEDWIAAGRDMQEAADLLRDRGGVEAYLAIRDAVKRMLTTQKASVLRLARWLVAVGEAGPGMTKYLIDNRL